VAAVGIVPGGGGGGGGGGAPEGGGGRGTGAAVGAAPAEADVGADVAEGPPEPGIAAASLVDVVDATAVALFSPLTSGVAEDGSTVLTVDDIMVIPGTDPVNDGGGGLGASFILPSMVLEMVVTAEQLPTGWHIGNPDGSLPPAPTPLTADALEASNDDAAPPSAPSGFGLPSSSAMKER